MEKKETVIIDSDLKEIIPIFMENRESDIADLKKNIEANNYDEIEKIGHQLKGAGGSYGFDYITEIGKEIENIADNNNPTEIKQLINELETYLDVVEISYD